MMIGQNLPGPHKKMWPYNFGSLGRSQDANKQRVTPYYAEMRSDLYGHERQFPADDHRDGGLIHLLLGPRTISKNTGVPNQQNIVLTLVNHEYESYRYSMHAATTSKVQAAREFGQSAFERALEKVLLRLEDRESRQQLTVLEERFLDDAGVFVDMLDSLRRLLVDTKNTTCLEQCNSTDTTTRSPFGYEPPEEPRCDINGTTTIGKSPKGLDLNADITNSTLKAQKALSARVELFLKQITDSLPPEPAKAIKDALVGHYSSFGYISLVSDLRKSPMRLHFAAYKRRLFVTHFWGDLFASTVSALRKEVTAIVCNAEPGDEVMVVLQSGGGTVTGYGLVAAQLLRIKEAGLKLTIAVEQVAASGGYMGHVLAIRLSAVRLLLSAVLASCKQCPTFMSD